MARATKKTNGTAVHTKARSFDREPISQVEWVHRSTLHANDYNPNSVAPPERELIVISILEDGWTQPIVTLADGEIVDGFHRWDLSADPRLEARYGGFVPITRIQVTRIHQQMSTIRHNRARGTHAVIPMASLVTRMLKDGIAAADIMRGLGMEDEEITRLATASGMPELASNTSFSQAWKPGEQIEGSR
jgi:ParB-like chromosome segregation protein Spo0J